jgi:hypothetical protein
MRLGRGGDQASVCTQTDFGGKGLAPHAPDLNPEEACHDHTTRAVSCVAPLWRVRS